MERQARHAGITSGCASCHDGTHAKGKSSYANHITTTAACETCHSATNFTAWGPGTPMNHAGITSACASCHDNTHAKGSASYAAHVPFTQACEYCHSASVFTAWGPGTKMNHTGISSGCAPCHDGTHTPAKGKPSGHPKTTADCSTCHTWRGTSAPSGGWSQLKAGLATLATPANVAKFEARRAELEKVAREQFGDAELRAKALVDFKLLITAKAGSEGKLFGSIGTADIAEAATKAGQKVARSEVRLPNGPLRAVGEHVVHLHLHTDVNVPLAISIVAEE